MNLGDSKVAAGDGNDPNARAPTHAGAVFAWKYFLVSLAISLLSVLAIGGAHAAETVGTITRIQNQAQVGGNSASVGIPVQMNDELRTGANSRLEITFRDDTKLTLGENARVVIDQFVYKPSQGRGALAVKAAHGAMRFVTGKIGQLKEHDVTVVTASVALAVRGTDVWVGPINGRYGVLLLKGKVDVSGNPVGRQRMRKG